MEKFMIPTNIYQLLSNFGIFLIVIAGLFMFKRIKVGKDGIEVEKGSDGNKVTMKTIYDKICILEKSDKIQSLDILRINFYLQKQPEEIKLICGLRYLKQDGNGKTRNDIYNYIESHKALYETIITLEPDLKLKELNSFRSETVKSI